MAVILRLDSKQQEVPGVLSFEFEPADELTWQAGQFIHYRLPHENSDDRGDKRFFTVSTAPYEGRPRITTRFTADKGSSFKRALKAMEPGDEIEALRVSGDFVMEDPSAGHVFIAGGIGVTPYRAILKQLNHDDEPINVTLLYGNRDDEIVFQAELEELASRHANLKIKYYIGEQIDEAAIAEQSDIGSNIYWLSGPEPMVESFAEMIARMGVDKGRVRTDYFPGYTWP